jgi:hypothetical protein
MEILSIILLAILIGFSLVAFFLVLEIFFSRRIARTRQALELSPGRAFLIGLVNLGFFGTLALIFAALADQGGGDAIRLVALAILMIPTAGIVFGLAGAVQLAGERLAPGKPPVWRGAAGAIALIFACGLPFVGWFGLLPFLCLLGLGGFIMTFFSRRLEVRQNSANRAENPPPQQP